MAIWQSLLALLLVLSPAAADDPTLAEYAAHRAEETGVPGLAWAVVSPAGVEEQGTVGVDGDGRPVDPGTAFVWGSVSKPVTATLLVQLEAEGLLDLDDPVVEHLPDFGVHDPAKREVTVRQLLAHTSGLPEGLDLLDRSDPDRTPARVVEEIARVDLASAPGEQHRYSGLGHVAAAAVAESGTDQTLEQALAARLVTTEDSAPPGHRLVLGRSVALDTPIDRGARAAGYLTGSLSRLAGFARTQLPGGPVLDDRQRRELHEPVVATGEGAAYALGWRTGPVPGLEREAVWHAGAAPGYAAAIVLVPGTDRAVVVLQNSYSPFTDEALLRAPDLAVLIQLGLGLCLVVALLAGWVGLSRRQRRCSGRSTGTQSV